MIDQRQTGLAKDRLEDVWKRFSQAILAVDRLSRALTSAAAETGFAVPGALQKRQEIKRQEHKQLYCFFDEGDDDLKRIICRLMEQSGQCELDRKPSELLEVARSIGALPGKIANCEPTTEKEKRAERAALGRYLEIRKGRTITVHVNGCDAKVNFDAIENGRRRRYRFTRTAVEPES